MMEVRKSGFLQVIPVLITILSLSFPAYAKYSGGSGTADDPYQIATAEDLMLLGESVEDYDKHFVLTADIDLDPNLPGRKVFDTAIIAPDTYTLDLIVSFQGTSFTGVFDGNDHTISHLTIDGAGYLGLFGQLVARAEVKDLGLVGVNIIGSEDYVGGLVGNNGIWIRKDGIITNCYSTGSVKGNNYVGGLVGSNGNAVLFNCYSTCIVIGSNNVGGFVGSNNWGNIDKSYSTGTVIGHGSVYYVSGVGGLVGYNSGTIDMSYSTGTVNGHGSWYEGGVGGLVGCNENGNITTSFSSSEVIGDENVGGLVGDNCGNINASYSIGAVIGGSVVGGLVGYNGSSITASYSHATVTGDKYIGGLVGFNDSCSFDLISWSIGHVTQSYSTGVVRGNEYVGGLIGSDDLGRVSNSVWDMETSGETTSDGGIGKTTSEMQTASTFLNAGWDFVGENENGTDGIWKISEGLDYPHLWWQKYSGGTGDPNNPYRIATAEDLMLLGESTEDYGKHFVLIADIDLDPNLPSRKVFDKAVIAPDVNAVDDYFQGTSFTGIFDGSGHRISHLTIEGVSYLGLFGQLGSGAIVKKLGLEAVDVNGTDLNVAGLTGENGGFIIKSYSTGIVNGGSAVGGIVGESRGRIMTSYSTCIVTGETSVGGLVGFNDGSIATSYSNGTVHGDYNVGGLVGFNIERVANSYSICSVSGQNDVGGLIGSNGWSGTTLIVSVPSECLIINCYSAGYVQGTRSVGGLVGDNQSDQAVNSFWDIETSGHTTSDCGAGKTTAEMQDISTYLNSGWDFMDENGNGTCDYWQISPGNYPRLTYPMMPEGLGTVQEPYLIRDARDLGTVWSEPLAHYLLEASIDLSGITWTMAVIPWFEGIFDGNGWEISNLNIQGSQQLGLFGELTLGAEVKNLGVVDVDINGSGDYIGGLVGSNGRWRTQGGIVNDCYSTGSVSGYYCVGGLVGRNGDLFSSGGVLTNCYSACTVNGISVVGGLVGSNRVSITTSYSTGTANGNTSIGGLVGSNRGGITGSYSTNMVTGNGPVGGLAGSNHGTIATSFSNGTVTGDNNVGGLVGGNWSGRIIESYSTGTVNGGSAVGGLVGESRGRIMTSYSTVTVSGSEHVGGLIGKNSGYAVTNCYSNGAITGFVNVGGLIGSFHGGPIKSSFWDIVTSGQSTSAKGTGLPTIEMQTAVIFLEAGWDFVDETENGIEDIWWIDEGQGYPRLWWEH